MEKIYVVQYSEDAFSGFECPISMKSMIEKIQNQTEDVIDGIYYDKDEYHKIEVEYASQAREGSDGTEEINSINELRDFFDWNQDVIEIINAENKTQGVHK